MGAVRRETGADETTGAIEPTLVESEPTPVESLEEENRRLREELERLRGERPGRPPRRRMLRRALVAGLVVLTSVSVLFGVVGVWVRRSVYNTSQFTAVVTPVANDPQVVDPLATYLTAQAIRALDLKARIENTLQAIGAALPNRFGVAERLGVLAVPLTTAAQDFVHDEVRAYLHSDRFRQLFNRLVVAVHGKLVALLRGEYQELPNVHLLGATVYLNTIPLLAEVLRDVAQDAVDLVGLNVTIPQIPAAEDPVAARERLSGALGVTLPADFGLIPIMSSARLHLYQEVARRYDTLLWLLIGVAILTLVLAVVLSPNRRRTLLQIGLGVTAALVLGGIVLRLVTHRVVSAVASPGARHAAQDVVGVMAHNLRLVAAVVLWPAVALAAIAYLAGRPPWLVRVARWVLRVTVGGPDGSELARFVAARYDWLVGGAAAVSLVLLFVFGIGWVSVPVVGVLLVAAIWWLTAVRAGERERTTGVAPAA